MPLELSTQSGNLFTRRELWMNGTSNLETLRLIYGMAGGVRIDAGSGRVGDNPRWSPVIQLGDIIIIDEYYDSRDEAEEVAGHLAEMMIGLISGDTDDVETTYL